MSRTLYIGIGVCWKLTQGIKDLIEEHNKISSNNLNKMQEVRQKYVWWKQAMWYNP